MLDAKLGVHNRPTTLAHVVLRTSPTNYQPMIQFYQQILNATIVLETPVITFLRFDHEHHRIAILQTPETARRPNGCDHAGLDHIAFTHPTLTSLAQTYLYLKSMKSPLHPVWVVNHGPTTSLYYRDPDGNKVELQVDNFDSPEQADAFMQGPLFGENPIGTDFDPDQWAEAVLCKVQANGAEGLSPEETTSIKTRREIGSRQELPEGF